MLKKTGLKKAGRYVYLVAIYLFGIAIGGVYTPDVISYAKQMNAQQVELPQIQQKTKPIKKRYSLIKRIS